MSILQNHLEPVFIARGISFNGLHIAPADINGKMIIRQNPNDIIFDDESEDSGYLIQFEILVAHNVKDRE